MLISVNELINQVKQQINEISCEQLASTLSNDIMLIDVRESSEIQNDMLPHAVNIPRGVLEMKISSHPKVSNEDNALQALSQHDIYLYCRSGARSALASQALMRMGLQRVYSMKGGSDAWKLFVKKGD